MAVDVLSGNSLLENMVSTYIDRVKEIPEVRYVAFIEDSPPILVTILDAGRLDHGVGAKVSDVVGSVILELEPPGVPPVIDFRTTNLGNIMPEHREGAVHSYKRFLFKR